MEVLIDIVGKVAPTVGRLLLGPVAGTVLDTLAESFGTTNDPTAIVAAIQNDPNNATQLMQLEKYWEAEIARVNGQRDNMAAVFDAYKLELDRGSFWSMLRPMSGWITLAQAVGFSAVTLWQIAQGRFEIFNYVMQMTLLMAPTAALGGIYFWQKSEERKAVSPSANVEGIVGTVLDKVLKR